MKRTAFRATLLLAGFAIGTVAALTTRGSESEELDRPRTKLPRVANAERGPITAEIEESLLLGTVFDLEAFDQNLADLPTSHFQSIWNEITAKNTSTESSPAHQLALALFVGEWLGRTDGSTLGQITTSAPTGLQRAIVAGFQLHAKNAPENALTLVGGLPPMRNELRTQLLRVAALEAARNDPDLALSQATQLQHSDRLKTVPVALGVWSRTDSKAAINYAKQNFSGELRQESFDEIAGELASVNPDEAFQLATDLGGSHITMLTVEIWARHDPAAALEAITKLKNPSQRRDAYECFTGGLHGRLVNDSLLAAFDDDRLPETEREQFLGELAGSIASDVSVDKALQIHAQMVEGPQKDIALGRIASFTLQSHPQQSFDLLEGALQPSSDTRDLASLARRWVSNDPEVAAAHAATLAANSRGTKIIIEAFMQQFGKDKNPSIVAWAEGLEDSDFKDQLRARIQY